MRIELQPIEPDDAERLQGLIESDPAYVDRVTGLPPGPADAQSLLLGRPPDVPDEHKLVLGAWNGTDLVGVVDLIRGWPDPGTAHVGLLQVRPDQQRGGTGRAMHAVMVDVVREWPEILRLRAAIVETNKVVEPFWRAMGYLPTDEVKPHDYANLHTRVQIWTRPLEETD